MKNEHTDKLAAIFKHAVAQACDNCPSLSPEEICEAFVHLAADGLDHPVVIRPQHVKVNPLQPDRVLMPQPAYLHTIHLQRRADFE